MSTVRRRRALLWGAPLAGAALAVLFFSSTGHDDCHITFWSAWSLAEHGEIVNYGGERLEQSSSLLHTLVLALLYRISGAPLPWLGYLLGIACACLAAVRLRALARACGWSAGVGLTLFAATCPAFAYWQLGKLESSLFTWCAVEYLIALVPWMRTGERLGRGDWIRLVLTTFALAAARPEGALVALAVGLALAVLARIRRGAPVARPLIAAAIAAGALLLLIAFREAYFGQAFPHPVMAKLGGGEVLRKAAIGLDYVAERLTSAGGGLLLAGFLGGLAFAVGDIGERRLERAVPVLFVGAYLSFVVLAGGDWMHGWRFVAHVEPLLGLLLFQALARVVADPAPRRLAALVLIGGNVLGMLQLGMHSSTGRPLWTSWQTDPAVVALARGRPLTWPERANMVHSRDVLTVAPLVSVLGDVIAARGSARVLTKQGGLLPFYAAKEYFGAVEVIDPTGLVSGHFHPFQDELDIGSDHFGLSLGIQDVLWLGERRSEEMFRPDVIFDIGTSSAWYASEHGYVLVYEQTGTARAIYTTLSGLGQAEEQASADEQEQVDAGDEEPADGDAEEQAEVEEEAPPMQGHRARMSRSLWEGEWPMYQYIAVREDIANELGMISVREARRQAPFGAAAGDGFLDWDVARLPYLRFFGGEPPERPVAGTFLATGEALQPGRQVVAPDPFGNIPGALKVRTVEVVDSAGRRRELRDARDYSVRGQGTRRVFVLMRMTARLIAGERVEIRGTTSAPGEHRTTILFRKSTEGESEGAGG